MHSGDKVYLNLIMAYARLGRGKMLVINVMKSEERLS